MRPTFEDLKTIWLLCYSRSAFHEAAQWIDEMELAQERNHVRTLVYAGVVAYARPFTQSQVAFDEGVIADVSPPPQVALAHSVLLNLRNTVIGPQQASP